MFLSSLTVFIMVEVSYFLSTLGSTLPCIEPPDLATRFSALNHNTDYRLLFLTDAVWDFSKIEDEFNYLVVEGVDQTQSHCPNTFLKGNFPLMIRSACPWYLEKTFDSDRYPQELYSANSKCLTCIGSNDQQKCEKAFQQIKILRKTGCYNGTAQYQPESVFIPIAFVCAQQNEVTAMP